MDASLEEEYRVYESEDNRLFPRTPADFRNLIKELDAEKRAYYTYTLNEQQSPRT